MGYVERGEQFRTTRRGLGKIVVGLGSLAFLELTNGISLKSDRLGKFKIIDEETVHLLREYSPTTVYHAGGNSVLSIKKSDGVPAELIEADLRQINGKLLVEHDQRPISFLPITLNTSTLTTKVGNPGLDFDSLLLHTSNNDKGLMIDLKDVSQSKVQLILRKLKSRRRDNVIFSSANWDILREIGRQQNDYSNAFFTIQNENSYDKFLKQDIEFGVFGVSLDKKLANSEIIQKLHELNAKVYIYTVDNPQEALEVLKSGADGLISNNPLLISVFYKSL